MDVGAVARLLIVVGLAIAGAGVLLLVFGRMPGIGRLPGDIVIHRDSTTIFIPLMTMLVLSVILSILLNLVLRVFR